jgi:hypothetical protein
MLQIGEKSQISARLHVVAGPVPAARGAHTRSIKTVVRRWTITAPMGCYSGNASGVRFLRCQPEMTKKLSIYQRIMLFACLPARMFAMVGPFAGDTLFLSQILASVPKNSSEYAEILQKRQAWITMEKIGISSEKLRVRSTASYRSPP